MPLLEKLLTWIDPLPRAGELNMAIDQALLKTISDSPLLRFYQWKHPSISVGYFESLATAKSNYPDQENTLHYIRRWTGGGIVDHRSDLTYTLIIPKSHPLSSLRGAESYHLIHQAVAAALHDQGIECKLTHNDSGSDSAACFENPVTHDILDKSDNKLAGAGQKRSRQGLLHQGSVIGIKDVTKWQQDLQKHLANKVTHWQPNPQLLDHATLLSTEKYATKQWLQKR